jgi:hypothetical protein
MMPKSKALFVKLVVTVIMQHLVLRLPLRGLDLAKRYRGVPGFR